MHDNAEHAKSALGLSQEQFAYGLKVSAADIADFESGKCPPSEEMQELIRLVYGVSEIWLHAGTGGMFVREADNMNYRWFMLWDAGGRHDPSHLWLVDKVAGFSDLKVALLADIAAALV